MSKYFRIYLEKSKTPRSRLASEPYVEDYYFSLLNPEDLKAQRQKLFTLDYRVKLSPEEFNTYQLYISNIYLKENTRRLKETRLIVTYYNYRFRREEQKIKKGSKVSATIKNIQVGNICEIAVRVNKGVDGSFKVY